MPSQVYFIDFRADMQKNVMAKLQNLLETAGLNRVVAERDLTAVTIACIQANSASISSLTRYSPVVGSLSVTIDSL